jgi:hypothetical protein
MGPKLNQEQIFKINSKVNKKDFIKIFRNEIPINKYKSGAIPDLCLMKSCYDIAIKENINDIHELKEIVIKILFITIKFKNIYRISIISEKIISLFNIIRDKLHNLINFKGNFSLEFLKLKSALSLDKGLLSIIENKWVFIKDYKKFCLGKESYEGTEEDFYKNVIELSKNELAHCNLKKQFLTIINRIAVDILVYM